MPRGRARGYGRDVVIRAAFAFVIGVHGLIHVMGFARAFGYGSPDLARTLTTEISKPAGLAWFAAAGLTVVAAVALMARADWWWILALPSALLSQALIVSAWRDAKFGSIANALVLFAALPAIGEALPTSLPKEFARAVETARASVRPGPIVTESDLAVVPPVVATWMRRWGVVGRPRTTNLRVSLSGRMKSAPDAPWMNVEAEQFSSFSGDPVRIFSVRASRRGVPFFALHRFDANGATMRVRVAGMIDVVDARGPKMDQAETVTILNDMCLLAPSTLLRPEIEWESADATGASVRFSRGAVTVRARLTFDASGDLVDFASNDRFLSADGKTYDSHPWSTPIERLATFDGRRLLGSGVARWHLPSGDFDYGRFEVRSIEFDPAR